MDIPAVSVMAFFSTSVALSPGPQTVNRGKKKAPTPTPLSALKAKAIISPAEEMYASYKMTRTYMIAHWLL